MATPSTLHTLRRPLAAVAALAACLVIPVCALASTGGDGGTGLSSGSSSSGVVTGLNRQVSVQGDGITLITTASGRTGVNLTFSGSASGDNGRTLLIQYRTSVKGSAWQRAASTTVAKSKFLVRWKASVDGHLSFRAVLVAAENGLEVTSSSASAAPSTPALAVTVFHSAIATWYGGKTMWGRRTACGEKLTPTTLGVANRTLKCGTKVAISFRGREITVPVIDRGPYAHNGASFDLTEATAKALHMVTVGIGTVGFLS